MGEAGFGGDLGQFGAGPGGADAGRAIVVDDGAAREEAAAEPGGCEAREGRWRSLMMTDMRSGAGGGRPGGGRWCGR